MRIGVLITVAFALAVAAGGWLWLGARQTQPGESGSGQRLFPGLEKQLNKVERIRVEHRGAAYDVLRKGDQWQLPGKTAYPVLFERVKPLLLGIAQLEKVEPQTDKPENYPRLGVQEPSAESANWRISLYAGAEAAVASLIVGKIRVGLIAGGRDGIYARAAGQPRAWLLAGNLELPENQIDWVDRQIIYIKPKSVKRVTIRHPDGDLLVIERPRRGAPEFVVANLPEGASLKDDVDLNPLARSLAGLDMEDVMARSDAGFSDEEAVSAVFETWDELEVRAYTVERAGQIFAWFEAGASALDSTDLSGVKTLGADHAGLAERVAGRVFRIPEGPGKRLRVRLDDVLHNGGEDRSAAVP